LTPTVRNSDRRVRHGHITKQGSVWVRWILQEAAHTAKRSPQFADTYSQLARRRGKQIATVAIARRLLARSSHPGAASSLREGLAETLTIGRLGVPPTLARTLRSTDESFKARLALSAGWDRVSLLGGRGRPRSQEQGRGAGSPAAQLAP
jgi:hypothetical protein